MRFAGAALPLHRDGLTAAAEHVGVDPAVLWSVVVVETSGCRFLPDRRPSILFERHIFRTRTQGPGRRLRARGGAPIPAAGAGDRLRPAGGARERVLGPRPGHGVQRWV